MVVGDFRLALAPGWQRRVEDEFLREDILAATAGEPSRRLPSVAELVRRLRSRSARAQQRQREREARRRAAVAERALERVRIRRPWAIAAFAFLVIGLGVSLWQNWRLQDARANAEFRADATADLTDFLVTDVLGVPLGNSLAATDRSDPPLHDILDASAPQVDVRFLRDPSLRAKIHRALARAYSVTGDEVQADRQLQAARVQLAFDPRSSAQRPPSNVAAPFGTFGFLHRMLCPMATQSLPLHRAP